MLAVAWLFLAAAPEALVDRAVEAHGSERLRDAEVRFTFRGERFAMDRRPNGTFRYRVEMRGDADASSGPTTIVVSNEGTKRLLGGAEPERATGAEHTKVNSVVYFASMPLPLLDPAVRLADAGAETHDGERLHRVRVTFAKEGGGADHEDAFMFWFRDSDGMIAYLAYRYATDGGGIRFRVPKNPREVRGVVFLDYDNYKTDDLTTPLDALLRKFEAGALERVSEVLTEDVCFARLGNEIFEACR